MKRFALPIIIVVIIVALVAAFSLGNHSPNNSANSASTAVKASPDGLPGLLTNDAPWPNNVGRLADRLSAIGLPQLTAEGTQLHIHQHLDIYVDGQAEPVPADIGIPSPETFISVIHTHDATGILHVESPTQQDYYLGQFFDIWGVKLTADCLGGYCNSGDKSLAVYVNGTKYTGDPRLLKLEAHQEIVVTYGTPSELPKPIPSSYPFPSGV